VIKAVHEFVPRLSPGELPRRFDVVMDEVYNGSKKRGVVIEDAKEIQTDIRSEYKEKDKKMEKELAKALEISREDERTLGTCLNCKTGTMKVFFSWFTKKRFSGCSNYSKCAKCGFSKLACKCTCEICGGIKSKCKDDWKAKKWFPSCQTGFPLPAVGLITSLHKTCETCGWPMIQVWRKGKRPFRMCINHKCASKEEWGKKKEEGKKVTPVAEGQLVKVVK